MTTALVRALRRVASTPRTIAVAWACVTLAVLALLASGPGVSRDEEVSLQASERTAAFAATLVARPAHALAGIPDAFGVAPAPPLAHAAYGAIHAVATRIGVPDLLAFRLGAALAGAFLTLALALLAGELAGRGGALLAPALFWLVPRDLQQGLVATPDVMAAALWIATVWIGRGAIAAPRRRTRIRLGLAAGLLFGAALATRTGAWALWPVLAAYAAVLRVARRTAPASTALAPASGSVGAERRVSGGEARPMGAPPDPSDRAETTIEARLHGAPFALVAMAVLGPAVLAGVWPWLWRAPVAHLSAAFVPAPPATPWPWLGVLVAGPRLPLAYPLAITGLTVPAAILWAFAGGLAWAVVRLVRAARRRGDASAADETLLLAAALAPVALSCAGLVPLAPGPRPWLPALPVLAVLAARALLAAGAHAWPSRSPQVSVALAILVLYPAARAVAHFHPLGGSAWNELAGGVPGAAASGLSRQDGGEAVAMLLDDLASRAAPGARVWFAPEVRAAAERYRRDGRVRADLVLADAPEAADLAVVPVDASGRDPEYRAWAAFGTARPAAGAYLDDVPVALLYARPGAWR